MNVTKRSEVIFSLHNLDQRHTKKPYPSLAFTVLRKDTSTTAGRPNAMGVGGYSLVTHVGLCRSRELQTSSLILDKGAYIVVPYTCEKTAERKGYEGGEKEERYSGSVRDAAGEIFERFDQDNDGHLNHKEVRSSFANIILDYWFIFLQHS